MARRRVRRSFRRSDPWPIVMILVTLACFTPSFAHAIGWWTATTAQREAANALTIGTLMALFAADTLRGQRRRAVSRRRLPDGVLAFIVLAAVFGIGAASAGIAVLLGASPALPIDALLLQLLFLICGLVIFCARFWAGPERLTL